MFYAAGVRLNQIVVRSYKYKVISVTEPNNVIETKKMKRNKMKTIIHPLGTFSAAAASVHIVVHANVQKRDENQRRCKNEIDLIQTGNKEDIPGGIENLFVCQMIDEQRKRGSMEEEREKKIGAHGRRQEVQE